MEIPALLVLLIVAGTRAVVTQDIVFGDEVGYLASGKAVAHGSLPGFAGSATYVDLYFLLSRLTPDSVGLYFAMRSLTAVAFVLGVWGACRILVSAPLAWAAAALAVAMPATYVWPGVSGPAAGAVLVGLALFVRFRSVAASGIASGLYWLAAGSRPEFTWLALLLSGLSVLWLGIESRARSRTSRSLIASYGAVFIGAIGVPLALVWLHGAPFAGGRSWVAFAQHYSLRNARDGQDPWLDAESIAERAFPGAETVVQAAVSNPSEFTAHLWANSRAFPTSLLDQVGSDQSVPLLMWACLVAGAVASVILERRKFNLKLQALRSALVGKRMPDSFPATIFVAALVAATAIPILVIFPRNHYMLVPAGLLILVLVCTQEIGASRSLSLVLPYAVVLILFVLLTIQTMQLVIGRMSYPAPNAQTLSLMNSANTEWKILSDDWGLNSGIHAFIEHALIVDPDKPPFDQQEILSLSELNVNAIWVNGNSNWRSILEHSGEADVEDALADSGFARLHPTSNMYIRDGD